MTQRKINRYWTLGHRLPQQLTIPLFGDRKRVGKKANLDDEDWRLWESSFHFRYKAQRTGIGKFITDWGFKIFADIDMAGKKVLEIGPGTMPHIGFWDALPSEYTLYDTRPDLLETSKKPLEEKGITVKTVWNDGSSTKLPFKDDEFDIVLAFAVLEHLDPLDDYLNEFKRIIKNGGIISGAIPSEGGVAWGFGRFLTTRRMVLREFDIDFNKVISWEHPNFAESIYTKMDRVFTPVTKRYWPLWVPVIDINLMLGFVYRVDKQV